MKATPEKRGYRDIKSEVFRRIRSNEWGPGTLLPGEVELAASFGCARATVNRAMQELSEDGIIDRRRKGGSRVKLAPVRQVTFEIPLVRKEIEQRGHLYEYKLLSDKIIEAPRWLVTELNLSPKQKLRHIKCLHSADATPYQFEDRWINLKSVPSARTADFTTVSPNEWLVSEVPYTNAEVKFSATVANAAVAKHLETETGMPVFLAERTTWLSSASVTKVLLHFAPGYQMTASY
jgi:GntR family transcriptional regulator, histidine utilization repressor